MLPCVDSPADAAARRRELDISRNAARDLGVSAVRACEEGRYALPDGRVVDWSRDVANAVAAKASLPPDAVLPTPPAERFPVTAVSVRNETTLLSARHLVDGGGRCAALNFANGVHPGGGFLHGARAQEEVLCRSSALYATLRGDEMYGAHRARPLPDSSDWVIVSPEVPVFRTDDGTALERPFKTGFLTCAAPYAPAVGVERSTELMQRRIRRVLAVAYAWRFDSLVLGAWGCGAFQNDTRQIAEIFRDALSGDFSGRFREVVFAIADWSLDRRYLGPFRDVFEDG